MIENSMENMHTDVKVQRVKEGRKEGIGGHVTPLKYASQITS